jgi:hypothetical protein
MSAFQGRPSAADFPSPRRCPKAKEMGSSKVNACPITRASILFVDCADLNWTWLDTIGPELCFWISVYEYGL